MKRCGFLAGCVALVALSSVAEATLVYVPNANGQQILKFVAETGEYKGSVGTGIIGPYVTSVAQSPVDGYLYVGAQVLSGSSYTGTVFRLDPYTGAYAGQIATGLCYYPSEIAFGANGDMYLGAYHLSGDSNIIRLNPTTGAFKGIFANGFISQSYISLATVGDTVYATINAGGSGGYAKFDGPTGNYQGQYGVGFIGSSVGLEPDSTGKLLVGSQNGASVMRFNQLNGSYQGTFCNGYAPTILGLAQFGNDQSLVRINAYGGSTQAILRFDNATGAYKGMLAANFGITGYGLASETPACVTGTGTLQNYVGPAKLVNYEIYEAGTGNLLDSGTVGPLVSGTYQLCTLARGNVDIYFKASHWLRKVVPNVTVARNGAVGVNFSLINGDVDGDNEVAPNDFSLLSTAFGNVLGDPGYDPEADLDGDEEVGPSDFSILSTSFGQVGD